MLARWSLRTKLVALVALALVPVLALSAWQARVEQDAVALRRDAALGFATDLAVARYGGAIEAARRMSLAACSSEAVLSSIGPEAVAAHVNRCESYLVGLLGAMPGQYSAALVTDEQGVVRCATAPAAVGMNLADRDIFQRARTAGTIVISDKILSRLEPQAVVALASPIGRNGEFRGMCMVEIPLKSLAETAGQRNDGIGMVIIDAGGVTVGGDAQAMRRLPTPARLVAATKGQQARFSDYGQDGNLYDFQIRPIDGSSLFAVASVWIGDGTAAAVRAWTTFALVALALAVVLVVIWLGADQWCVRPLRYIQDFADKVARGEEVKFVAPRPWTPEMVAVGAGVTAMAEAIASREAELRAGLEQRDHMLREIHHRVKNNLQMISSLLNLQAGEIRSPRIRRFFGDAQNRVLTLSILHRHLYERSSWSLVDFQQFISDLVRQISVGRSAGGRPVPRYHIRAPIMAVGPDTAIPIGLIVTEAVGIALGRDFGGAATPEIRIEANEVSGDVELAIEDNGGDSGMSGLDSRGGFGITLIKGLAMQLGGEARIERSANGANRVVVIFPTPASDEAADA